MISLPPPVLLFGILLAAGLLALRGPRIGALAGLLHAWWIAPVGVIAPLIILAVVLLAPQMPDMFAGMADGAKGWGWWHLGRGLGCASGVLGLAAWYWTRAVLNAEAGQDDRPAPHGPAWQNDSGLSDFWRAFCGGYRQAARWAVLPAALLAAAPPLLAWLRPALKLEYHWDATLVSLVIFAATVLPFVIYRRATIFGALAPLTVWLVLMFTVRDSEVWFWWARIGALVALSLPAWLARRKDWSPKHIPGWVWRYPPLGLFAGAPLGWPAGVVLLALAPAIAVAIEFWPWIVAAAFSAPTAAMIAVALVIGPFTLALVTLRAVAPPWGSWAAAPGGSTVKLLAGVIALVWLVFVTPDVIENNLAPGLYRVRSIEGPQLDTTPYGRPSLQDALQTWRAAQIGVCHHPVDAPMPVIIAAAEGGASRAALWFLSAARTLDDNSAGRFGRYLFAINGVSGGSLGGVTYLQGLVADRANGSDICAGLSWQDKGPALDEIANRDFLAPALAGFFLDDALMRLLPMQWLWPHYQDRAALLEHAFEQAWPRWWPQPEQQILEGQQAATEGLVALRNRLIGLAPELFLNGTDVDAGRRLITSTTRFTAADEIFPLAEDVLTLLGHDVPAATSVTNSARFPMISPAGRLPTREVIDGGYFDNYGSRTADDLVVAIQRLSDDNHWNLVPIVVVVSNDAAIKSDELGDFVVSCAQHSPRLPDMETLDPAVATDRGATAKALQDHRDQAARGEARRSPTVEGLAPVLGLIATRAAHGDDGLQILRHRLCDPHHSGHGHLFHIALPKPGPEEAAPMNWVLNDEARTFLLDHAPKLGFNVYQAQQLARTLDQIVDAHAKQQSARSEERG